MSATITTNPLESGLLRQAGFSHAFFTRFGGVSSGPYASLNFSSSVGDTNENVADNTLRAARYLGIEARRLYWLSQVHGRDVEVVTGSEDPREVLERRADALVTSTPGVGCGVRSADCVPVLLADRHSGRVAAAHAGWRGLVAGIVPATAARLRDSAPPGADLIAAIGPHISVDAFEVGDEVAAALAALAPDEVVVRSAPGAPARVDLRAIVHVQLRASGLGEGAIDDVFGCTVADPKLFFSYRRDGPRSGRHLSAIVAR